MDLFSAMKVSSAGLSVQRTRMNAVSSNLANVNTTRTAEGGPYRRKEVVVGAVNAGEPQDFKSILAGEVSKPEVLEVRQDMSEFRRVYDPTHPDADADGYVHMPNVEMMKEMVDMLSATRAYEANTAVIKSVKEMANKAIELGR